MEAMPSSMRSPSSRSRSASASTALSDASEVAVSGRNKGIQAIDLGQVFSSDDARVLALITCFDLSHNEMEVVSNLEQMTALRKLNVSYNRVGRVAGLPLAITQLNLSHNRLCHLEGLRQLPHLRELDVSFNRLTSLIGLSTRQPLEVLHADDNRLVSTAGLEDLGQLRILTLSNNFVSSADELVFLSTTPSLQILTMKNNPVTQQSGFRGLVGRMQSAVLSLDGAPLLRPPERWQTPRRADVSGDACQARRGASPAAATPPHARSHASPGRAVAATAPTSSPSAHLVVTPSASKPAYVPADVSLESEAPEANCAPPQPTEPTSSRASRAVSAISAEDDALSTSHFSPSGRGSYARQFLAAKQQENKHTPLRSRSQQDSLRIHAPWTQPDKAAESHVTAASERVARGERRALAETAAEPAPLSPPFSPPPPPPPPAAQPPSPSTSPSVLVRPAEVQAVDAQLAQLHDTLVAHDLLKRENEQLRGAVKRLERQLADSRRVVSDQLAELSRTRLERDALRQSEDELKARCERVKRASKMQESHHQDELLTLQSQYERVKTFYEAELADLRRQLATELHRSRQSSASADTTMAKSTAPVLPPPPPLTMRPLPASLPAPSSTEPLAEEPEVVDGDYREAAVDETTKASSRAHRRAVHFNPQHRSSTSTSTTTIIATGPVAPPAAPPSALHTFSLLAPRTGRRASSQEGISPLSDSAATPPAPAALARQLKGWLYTEMATDADRAQEEAILSRLRTSVEAEETALAGRAGGTTTTSVSSTDARALLEAFVLRQMSTTPDRPSHHVEDETEAGHAVTTPPLTVGGAPRSSLEVVEAREPREEKIAPLRSDIVENSPDARQLPVLELPRVPTPSPLPSATTTTTTSATTTTAVGDEHAQALRAAEGLLDTAAHRLRLSAAAAVLPAVSTSSSSVGDALDEL